MGALSTLATQFAQSKLAELALARKRRVERKRVDTHYAKGQAERSAAAKKTKPLTPSQKAAGRRKSIMKKVPVVKHGYQRLMKTLGDKNG